MKGPTLPKLQISIAVGNYDRNRPLIDGEVAIDGVDPVYMLLSPEEIFFRAFRQQAFDICELSLSSSRVKAARGTGAYVGRAGLSVARVPPHLDLRPHGPHQAAGGSKGKRIGVPEYQLTANVWARAILEDEYGVKPSDIHWVRGGIEHAGRPEKISVTLPPDVALEDAPEGRTISTRCWRRRDRRLHRRRARRHASSRASRTSAGCSPTRRRRPRTITAAPASSRSCTWSACAVSWPSSIRGCPAAVLKAFDAVQARGAGALADTSATKVTLPFVEEQLKAARAT